jgi:hypothetical protein
MLNYSDLTVVKNSDGIPTALGYPVNSILLQQDKPLFMSGGGGGKKSAPLEELAVPSGLVCVTQTTCHNMGANDMGANDMGANEPEQETVPIGLYEQLLALAETRPTKKLSKRHHKKVGSKNKTHRKKK